MINWLKIYFMHQCRWLFFCLELPKLETKYVNTDKSCQYMVATVTATYIYPIDLTSLSMIRAVIERVATTCNTKPLFVSKNALANIVCYTSLPILVVSTAFRPKMASNNHVLEEKQVPLCCIYLNYTALPTTKLACAILGARFPVLLCSVLSS